MCVCVCVYTGGKKKNKRTGVEKRWERKANSLLIPGTGSSRHPKGRMLSYVQHNVSVGQTGALNPVLSDCKYDVTSCASNLKGTVHRVELVPSNDTACFPS